MLPLDKSKRACSGQHPKYLRVKAIKGKRWSPTAFLFCFLGTVTFGQKGTGGVLDKTPPVLNQAKVTVPIFKRV
jgi:hypothetical protein